MDENMTSQAMGPFIAKVPIVDGRGYQTARFRLYEVMRALQVNEVSTAIAVGEFSVVYKALPHDAEIGISFSWETVRVRLDLELLIPIAIAQQITEKVVHFHWESRADENDLIQLNLGRSYPVEQGSNPLLAGELLATPTAEELERESLRTQQFLEETQIRLDNVQEDLRIAAEIQQKMLVNPSRMREIHPAANCYAIMEPCQDIGGDFYDVINQDIDHLAVVVGDVSGKGVTAALMMATCITLLRAFSESFRSPSRIMRKINPRLIEGNEEDCLFTTLFLAIINTKNNSLIYCNAGHNPAILQHSDGSIEELAIIHGPALGVFDDIDYEQTRVDFNAGDRLLLFTDGVSETFNPSGELYGIDRLLDHYQKTSSILSPSEVVEKLLLELNHFSEREMPHDDITMVAIQRHLQSNECVVRFEQQEAATAHGITTLLAASENFCNQQLLSTSISGRLQLILDELFVNVMNHGSVNVEILPNICLELRYLPDKDLLVVEVRDNGVPFNPFALAEPDTSMAVEERELGGLGIFLVRSLAQSFSYSYETPWNSVLLEIKSLDSES